MKSIGTFLRIASVTTISFVEFMTYKLKIYEYTARDRNGTIDKIVQCVIMSVYLVVLVVPALISERYSEAE